MEKMTSCEGSPRRQLKQKHGDLELVGLEGEVVQISSCGRSQGGEGERRAAENMELQVRCLSSSCTIPPVSDSE